jgi:hypothetical protein
LLALCRFTTRAHALQWDDFYPSNSKTQIGDSRPWTWGIAEGAVERHGIAVIGSPAAPNNSMQLSFDALLVLKTIVLSTVHTFYCYDISRRTGVRRDTVRTVFRQMETDGWVTNCEPVQSTGCRIRRDYTISDEGVQRAREVLEQLQIGTITGTST